MKKNICHRKNFNIWQALSGFWTVVYFLLIVFDFAGNNSLGQGLDAVAFIYVGVLAIYVSNKEFERWYDAHQDKHPGEVFVIFWSILVLSLFLLGIVLDKNYHIPGAVISSYIAVLTILAVTEKSKALHRKHHKKIK